MSNFTHTAGVAAFAIAVGLASTAFGQFSGDTDHTGRVAQYSRSPDGAVDGLILSDGTEVRLAPDAASGIVAVAHPGDTVIVRGRPAAAGAAVIDAMAVVNTATGELAGAGPFGNGRQLHEASQTTAPSPGR